MKISPLVKRLSAAFLAAALLTVLAVSGLLRTADNTLCDALYQTTEATDGQVIVVGMDKKATDRFGPMPWSRNVVAQAISYLNADPENRPAAIGIDVLYTSASSDPEADAALLEALSITDNVVLAAAGTFGSDLVTSEDGFYMDTRALLDWDSPYGELTQAASIGHINAMADTDSLIRHALLYIDVPDTGRVYSFSRVLYEKYAAYHNITPTALPETTDGFFYLPFTGDPGSYYDGVSIVDLVDGVIDPEYFAGKVILIGPYTAGMQDEYRTSVDHASPMYGIEIQANLIDAYRSGFYPKSCSSTLQFILLFLIAFAAYCWFQDRKVLTALLGWVLASGVWILLCMLLYRLGIILQVFYIPMSLTVIFMISVALNYIRAQREKKRVSATFGRYVDPAIMKELLEQGGSAEELGGKMHNIAVLFVDIRGFTTMSESLDPPTVVEIINMYLTLTTECIMRHHGTLDKFVGDCTMAFWNAPIPQEDPIYLACCAAMDMVEGSKALGAQLQERFGRSVSFGVGVHYGPAVVGNIGAPRRMDYTAIGDTVNTASRLESNAPSGTVYISRTVADALGDRAKTTSLGGSIKLKGKAEGFEVLTLDELKMPE